MSETTEYMGGSKEHVAFELMKFISERDAPGVKKQVEDPKGYYLALYGDCLAATYGEKPRGD